MKSIYYIIGPDTGYDLRGYYGLYEWVNGGQNLAIDKDLILIKDKMKSLREAIGVMKQRNKVKKINKPKQHWSVRCFYWQIID